MSEMKPAYLIAGGDEAKIDTALARLRARAEREGGPGSLEAVPSSPGAGADSAKLVAAIPAMSLMAARRYLVADGVERWSASAAAPVVEALAGLPEDLTVVLVAREEPPRLRAPKALRDAVEAAGGDVVDYPAPTARQLPSWLVSEAKRRGFHLAPDAARLLAERMGESTTRLANELDRLALWSGGGELRADDLAAMVADTSEEAVWALSDTIVERDAAAALSVAERLDAQGEETTALVYQAAKRLREAHAALLQLESGRPAKQVEQSLSMHPYAAKMLMRRLSGATVGEVRAAACAIADLEWWTRGGSDYPERVAVTLALRRATGAGEGG